MAIDTQYPDRRSLLLGAGALGAAAALGLRSRPARASELALGEGSLTVVSDGSLVLPMAFFLPDRAPQEVADLFEPRGLPVDAVRPDCNVTLFRRNNQLVLFDAGAGANFQATAGKLGQSLAAAGVDPTDITDVVFTHAHPDHIWGVLDDFDEPAFPAATHWVAQAEWDFWRADETLGLTPEDRKSFVVGARNRFDAIEDRVSLFKPGEEILSGVEAVGTEGHTPGHVSFMLHGGDRPVMVTGDALSHAVLSFERPDWHIGSDWDAEQGARTRKALLDRLASDKAQLVGFHLPYPGIGSAERSAGGYRFVAA